MLQQIIALIIIAFFLSRLIWQKKREKINGQEFVFWLIFWFFAGLAIVFLKKIDQLVAGLGFSGSGIEVLLYVAVAVLFYLIFRVRMKLEKIERDVTKIVREIAMREEEK
jgi:hypothetical protein